MAEVIVLYFHILLSTLIFIDLDSFMDMSYTFELYMYSIVQNILWKAVVIKSPNINNLYIIIIYKFTQMFQLLLFLERQGTGPDVAAHLFLGNSTSLSELFYTAVSMYC